MIYSRTVLIRPYLFVPVFTLLKGSVLAFLLALFPSDFDLGRQI
jgi:hypothetical protein